MLDTTHEPCCGKPTAVGTHSQTRPGPHRRLPNSVACDLRLDADELALLALRSTFVGTFRMLEHFAKARLGIGRDRLRAILRRLRELGYLDREQGRTTDGTFAKAVEGVNFDAAPAGRPGFQIVLRSLFDMGLPAKSVGELIWLRSHANGFKISAAQVARRFRWGKDALQRQSRPLREAGLLPRCGYRLTTGPAVAETQESAKPGTGKPGPGFPPTVYKTYEKPKITKDHSQHVRVARVSRDDNLSAGSRELVSHTTEEEDLGNELARQDWARVLNRRRLLTREGLVALRGLIGKYGRDAVVATVQAVLARAAMDGDRPGRIVTWTYFETVLWDEARLAKMQQAGIRPGDVLGAWRTPVSESATVVPRQASAEEPTALAPTA